MASAARPTRRHRPWCWVMTEVVDAELPPIDPADPTMAPFWSGARRRELLLQRCSKCHVHQFYPRPLCLACEGTDLAWVVSGGLGTVYSVTLSQVQVLPELPPPYAVALIDLDEGPRLLSNVIEGDCSIGARVRVVWRERPPLPPLPIFTAASVGTENE